MDLPSYALQLEYEPATSTWFIRLGEDARVTFDSYEEGLEKLQFLLASAREREQAELAQFSMDDPRIL